MKFVSWNVNGIRACLTKGFEDRFRAIISTGIMQTGRDIPERRSLQSRSRFLFFMG